MKCAMNLVIVHMNNSAIGLQHMSLIKLELNWIEIELIC